MFIRGEKLCLRALEPTDVELLYRWENDPAIWKISQTQKPFSHYTLQMFVEVSMEELNKTGQLRLMVDLLPEEADQIPQTIGIVDIFEYDPFHQKAGLGILIHQDYREINMPMNCWILPWSICFPPCFFIRFTVIFRRITRLASTCSKNMVFKL